MTLRRCVCYNRVSANVSTLKLSLRRRTRSQPQTLSIVLIFSEPLQQYHTGRCRILLRPGCPFFSSSTMWIVDRPMFDANQTHFPCVASCTDVATLTCSQNPKSPGHVPTTAADPRHSWQAFSVHACRCCIQTNDTPHHSCYNTAGTPDLASAARHTVAFLRKCHHCDITRQIIDLGVVVNVDNLSRHFGSCFNFPVHRGQSDRYVDGNDLTPKILHQLGSTRICTYSGGWRLLGIAFVTRLLMELTKLKKPFFIWSAIVVLTSAIVVSTTGLVMIAAIAIVWAAQILMVVSMWRWWKVNMPVIWLAFFFRRFLLIPLGRLTVMWRFFLSQFHPLFEWKHLIYSLLFFRHVFCCFTAVSALLMPLKQHFRAGGLWCFFRSMLLRRSLTAHIVFLVTLLEKNNNDV